MLSDRDRDYLAKLAATRAEQAATLATTDATRDAAIQDALAHGAGVTELARIFDLSRVSIYQIRDRRR